MVVHLLDRLSALLGDEERACGALLPLWSDHDRPGSVQGIAPSGGLCELLGDSGKEGGSCGNGGGGGVESEVVGESNQGEW